MNITTFDCFCGQSLEIDSCNNGRQINCPICRQVLIVPGDQPSNAIRVESTPPVYLQHRSQPNKPITIEQTSKNFKGMQLIAALLMILGVGGCATGFSPMSMSILFLIGAAVWMVASIGAWWNHG